MNDKINKDSEPYTIENFYGVYLLESLNENYSGRTYIGFTVDPNRRIKQHNNGIHAGGAKKTSNKGPWKMVLIVHGFPNNVAALRFEWAWQNPENSRRLYHISHKKRETRKESPLQYRLRILSEMLNVGPWNRLPLTIRWLESSENKFDFHKIPPLHMPICHGAVKSKKISNSQEINHFNIESRTQAPTFSRLNEKKSLQCNQDDYYCISPIIDNERCVICTKLFSSFDCVVSCLYITCDLICHMICLADLFLEIGEYIPIEGKCPRCKNTLLWGDIIRKMKGCNDKNVEDINEEEDSLIHNSFSSNSSDISIKINSD